VAELFLVPKVFPADDAEARTAALDATRSFIVEAPAGSGKTGLLIQRFLKLLTAENVTDPAQILAITFTRKATVEMRDRVLGQLQAANAGTAPKNEFDRLTRPLAEAVLAQDRRHGWSLLDYPRRLNIRTIDSISADIARSLPILSGASAALTPTEDAQTLYAEAARRTLMLLGGEDRSLSSALETILLHRDANLAECESLIASMLGWRDQWGELIPIAASELNDEWLEAEVLPKLEKALDHAICRGLSRLSKALPADVLNELCMLAADMGHLDGYNGNPSPIAICAGRYSLPGEKAEHLNHWRALIDLLVAPSSKTFRKSLNVNVIGFMIRPDHRKQLLALIDRVRNNPDLCKTLCSVKALPPVQYPPEQWDVTKALFRVLNRALVELQFVFADRGECDFAELGLLARVALRRETAVEDLAVATGLNLQHLLVDEMQDTSTSQYELIHLLTRNWDGHSQTVFLVGDPKQSIYLFRQARVERFVQTMLHNQLGDLPLTPLHLTRNFRSQANLVKAFNDDFSRLFPEQADPTQPELVPYLPAQATRSPGPAAARTWHTSTLPYTTDADEKRALQGAQRQHDARKTRALIEARLAIPLPPDRSEPWSLAVLVRNRSHLLEIVSILKEAPAIPFRAIEIEPLAERQEILDLLALTRALLHPADHTAWLALLRTPWCGLTLADLHLLAGADDDAFANTTIPELIASRGDLLPEDGIARLAPFYTVMHAALAQRGRLGLAQWVERTWRSFHANSFSTHEELTNAERFFTLLEELEIAGGRLDLSMLQARLSKLYAAPSIHPGAVDLMTIHGSKGLEWDVVFLPALERVAQTTRSRLLSWLEMDGPDDDSVAPGILAPIQGKGTASKELNTWMRGIESAREEAERKRLFYVACTRAREQLHLFAAPMRNKDGDISRPATSLLASAWPAAEEHFAATPTPILTISLPQNEPTFAIAASAGLSPLLIQRIPLDLAVAPTPVLPYGLPQRAAFTNFDRPEGSFASRAFGNTVHAFLEQITLRLASGIPNTALADELPTWHPRIVQSLRASGLAPTQVDRLATRVMQALRNTLTNPEGQWILSPHPQATSESALTLSASSLISLRMDRTFRAGPTPLSPGDSHLWVIDYKTAALGGRNPQTFLDEQRETYRPQMESYANALITESHPVRLALYYPLLPRLIVYEDISNIRPEA
jgi:ATP-dependent helicase/nuclease subunit A